jgi:cell division protein FtsQ
MLVLKNDIQVFFGPAEEVAKKDLIARSILKREKNIVYINVRITDRPTWRGLNAAN